MAIQFEPGLDKIIMIQHIHKYQAGYTLIANYESGQSLEENLTVTLCFQSNLGLRPNYFVI
jgi:hypothetical protein